MGKPRLGLVVGLVLFVACGGSKVVPDTDSGTPIDSGVPDASSDAKKDSAPVDAAPDVGSDAATDAPADVVVDAPVDAGISRALRFDGVDDVVNFTIPAGSPSETAFTEETWFKTTAATGMLLEVYGSGADRSLYVKTGKVCFYVFTPSYSEICSVGTFNDGNWHHAAGALGTGGQELYVDGVSAASAPSVTASAFVAETGLRAGYGSIGPNGPLTYFAGDLDEVRLWTVKRTATEIANNRSVHINPSTSNLQGYWMFDETGSAASAADATAGAHPGTLVGFTFNPSPWVSPGAF